MTSAVERIEEISRAWRMQHDALKVVRREIARQAKGTQYSGQILAKTLFEETKPDSIEYHIKACQQAAAEFSVLSMWAVFERRLFERLEYECRSNQTQPANDFNRGVLDKVVSEIERWQLDKALDLMKPLLGNENIGLAKQIKQYRDWVAHRNPRKQTPPQIDPDFAKELLSA